MKDRCAYIFLLVLIAIAASNAMGGEPLECTDPELFGALVRAA